jgi:hypothetical protein
MSFEFQYCVNENQIKPCNKDICYLCFWIMNSDPQVELYVEEGTSLGALLEQIELDYTLGHIPFSDLETYFNNQALSSESMSSSSSSGNSSSSSNSSSISDNQPSEQLSQHIADTNSDTKQFDSHVIANACINAANAAATAAAAAATIMKSFSHNK